MSISVASPLILDVTCKDEIMFDGEFTSCEVANLDVDFLQKIQYSPKYSILSQKYPCFYF